MKLYEALKNLKYDTRLIEWNMQHKTLSEDELKAHLAKLEDCANAVESLDLEGEDDMNGASDDEDELSHTH